jgi:endonuclease/exonuclease/phosphatase family metal-dependent hydrolase
MPTSEHEDDEVEELYGVIEEMLEEDGKGNTNTIIMGDWNSVVGDEPYRNIVGPHGLGNLKLRRGYSHLKEKALDHTMWRARFERGFGPVVRQTTK